MEEPKKPYQPYKFEYEAKVERKYIYSCVESLGDEWDQEQDEKDEEKERPLKPIGEVDLAWLLTQVPEGIKPEQIKIEFGYNASSMAFEDHYIRFYYDVTIPARKVEYKADKKKYEADLAQYEKDLIAHQEWHRAEEIRKTEEKLARLKGR